MRLNKSHSQLFKKTALFSFFKVNDNFKESAETMNFASSKKKND